ncbi:MAG: hypothetical protein AAGI53_10215 [Planctomycetota bacterium]
MTESDRPEADRAQPNDIVLETRRGTAIIVVIGALSLVAVFAALYVTIGQGDQRTAIAATITREVEDVDRAFAERIIDVIREDRFAVFPVPYVSAASGTLVPDTQRFVREATDYPYTDFSMRSQFPAPSNVPGGFTLRTWRPDWFTDSGNNADEARRVFGFNAAGNHSLPYPTNIDPDPRHDLRVASDPWLAATEPTAIVWRQLPLNSSDSSQNRDSDGRGRSIPNSTSGDRHSHPALRYLDNHDWAQISNIAPDGRFVNLFNLRGNFEAEPGIGEGKMTSRLTLLEMTQMKRFGDLRATTQLPNGLGDMAASEGEVADVFLNIPAIWTMNQRHMFFPLNQPEEFAIGKIGARDVGNNDSERATWGDFEYPDYQYADADGDGMADSRWFELADASDPNNVVFGLPVSNNRYFAAARIIDLSSLVNVNVATDSLTPPSSWAPSGMTPSDIDLRRLLTMTDPARAYRNASLDTNRSPGPDVISPNVAWRAWTLSGGTSVNPVIDGLSPRYFEQPLGYGQAEGVDLVASNYFGYNAPLDGALGSFTPAAVTQVAKLSGAFAYDAIRREVEQDPDIGLEGNGAWFGTAFAANDPLNFLKQTSPFDYGNSIAASGDVGLFNRYFNSVSSLTHVQRGVLARGQYYNAVGSLDASDPSLQANAGSLFGSNLFGVGDLAELSTFRGVNDDDTYSRLERVTSARFGNGLFANDPETFARFGPLRANRPDGLERRAHDNVTDFHNEYSVNEPDTLGPDIVIDLESSALFATDVRSRLTTISGASPIRGSILYDYNALDDDFNLLQPWEGSASGAPDLLAIGVAPDDGDYPDTFQALQHDARIDLRKLVDAFVDTSGSTTTGERRRAADTLFRVYADALAPDTGLLNGLAWEDNVGAAPLRTLSYGNRGPEPSMHAAAHMAVNFIDIIDEEDVGPERPTAATLIIDGNSGDETGSRWAYPGLYNVGALTYEDRDYAFQWGWADDGYIFDLDADTVRTDVTNKNEPSRASTRLHRSLTAPDLEERRAVTVFGIEAHPIITEVSSIIVYSESDAPPSMGTIPAILSADPAGSDVALQAMAFQIHNPFDESIQLRSSNSVADAADAGKLEQWDYYIEFNGWYYPLAEYEYSTVGGGRYQWTQNDLTLGPGETRVFYAFNYATYEDLEANWASITAAFGEAPPVSNPRESKAFFDDQFRGPSYDGSGPQEPILTQAVDPRIGVRLFDGISGPLNLFDAPTVATVGPDRTATNDEVRLWKTYANRSSAGATSSRDSSGEAETMIREDYDGGNDLREHWIENDILVDRLRDPGTDTWDVSLSGDERIDTATGTPSSQLAERPGGVGGFGGGTLNTLSSDFHSSFTITQWASVRRPDHVVDTSGAIAASGKPRGAVPAYMLESITGNAATLENLISEVLVSDQVSGDLQYIRDFCNGETANDFATNIIFDGDRVEDAYVAYSFESFLDSIGFFASIGAADPTPTANSNAADTPEDRAFVATLERDPFDKGPNVDPHLNDSLTALDPNLAIQYTPAAASGTVSPETSVDPTMAEFELFEIQPELFTKADGFEREIPGTSPIETISTLRVTDILRPMAIGPAHFAGYDINSTDAKDGIDVAVGEWLTLGEALSIALGFEDPMFYDDNREANGTPKANAYPALGLGYTPLADAIQRETGTVGTTEPVRMFDRGQLRLTDYVPFVNASDLLEVRDLPLYQPEFGDYRMHPGQTAASRVLSSLRTITPRIAEDDEVRDNELTRAVHGTMNISTAAVTNMRMLPGLSPTIEVDLVDGEKDEWWGSRPVPASSAKLLSNGTNGRDSMGLPDPRSIENNGTNASSYDVTAPFTTAPDLWRERPDIAAAIVAGRDRGIADFRFDSRESYDRDDRIDGMTFAPMLFNGQNEVNRFGLLARNANAGLFAATAGIWSPEISADRGRYMLNGIEGIRETPGFDSTADLLSIAMASSDPLRRAGVYLPSGGYIPNAALDFTDVDVQAGGAFADSRWEGDIVADATNVKRSGFTYTDDAPELFGPHDIFSWARDYDKSDAPPAGPDRPDGRNLGTREPATGLVNDLVFTADPYLYENNSGELVLPDELPNDYDEQLAVLAGLMNTTDVRSDYFAAWFVIRGYTRDDVEGLSEIEPMLPSYQKRFLLILDRSNVVSASDQPRILLYRELPL